MRGCRPLRRLAPSPNSSDDVSSVQIEGALTMFFAIIAALVLPDFPHNSRHFSKAELELAQLRMTEDVGTKDDTKVSNWTAFKFAMGDYKLWTMVFALTSMVISLSVSSFFRLKPFSCQCRNSILTTNRSLMQFNQFL